MTIDTTALDAHGGPTISSTFPYRASVEWVITALEILDDGLFEADCPGCESLLDLHQPDENDPDRMLATCGGCGGWYVIEVSPDGDSAFLITMPGVEVVRAKLAELNWRLPPQPIAQADQNPESQIA